MYFNKWLEIRIEHEYYDDGVCRDLVVRPFPETDKLLAGHKMRCISTAYGANVFFQSQVKDSGPVVSFREGTRLYFVIYQKNQYLCNFTNLPVQEKVNHCFYLDSERAKKSDNVAQNVYELTIVEECIVECRPFVFNYALTEETANSLLKIIAPDGTIVYDKAPENGEKIRDRFIDLQGFSSGLYTFIRKSGETPEITEKYFLFDRMIIGKPFAIIGIGINDSIDYENVTGYVLRLQTRKAPWKYTFYLTKDYNKSPGFSVSDMENYSSANGSRYTEEISFVETTGVESYTKGNRLVFESGELVEGNFKPQEIPFYESPKLSLKFKKRA